MSKQLQAAAAHARRRDESSRATNAVLRRELAELRQTLASTREEHLRGLALCEEQSRAAARQAKERGAALVGSPTGSLAAELQARTNEMPPPPCVGATSAVSWPCIPAGARRAARRAQRGRARDAIPQPPRGVRAIARHRPHRPLAVEVAALGEFVGELLLLAMPAGDR